MSDAASPSPRLISAVVGALILVVWAIHSWSYQGIDPDLYWHLKYGQLILAHHQLFEHDVFSWSAPGAFWLNQEWLGQILTAKLYALGGFAAFPVARWVMMVLEVALLTWLAVRQRAPFWLAAALAVVVQFLFYGQGVYRLQHLTTIGVTLTVLALQQWWLGRSMTPALVAMPLVTIAWANLHGGGAIAGPISAAIVAAVEAVLCLASGNWRRWRSLGALAALMAIALFVTPHGAGLPLHSLATLRDPVVHGVNAYVVEWWPFDWNAPIFRTFVLWWLLLVLAALATRQAAPLSMVALALAWGFMALGSRRHVTIAVIASAPLAAMWLAAAWEAAKRRGTGARAATLGVGGAIAALLVWMSPVAHGVTAIVPAPYPSEAALRAVEKAAPGHRLLNFYEWGGLLIFDGYPRTKVFIDGRAYLYGERGMADYDAISLLKPGWFEVVEARGIDVVFMPAGMALPQVLAQSPDWLVEFKDDTAMLLTHIGPGGCTRPPAGAPTR